MQMFNTHMYRQNNVPVKLKWITKNILNALNSVFVLFDLPLPVFFFNCQELRMMFKISWVSSPMLSPRNTSFSWRKWMGWIFFIPSLFQKVKDSTLVGTKSGCHIILGSISELLLCVNIVYGMPTVWDWLLFSADAISTYGLAMD